ncbi:L,D-transpeptidase scaffold domain-containing protein [Pedobacter boryungensis]|uniref:L,D-transpeptidase family protein n=1 Tax=Pedobacter boryungensis TaxID=869962 RepID=A0ABX2D8F2_9SPHI|nr:L,D-transpeptidase family protein [Pedobacter boryungensis]NQX30331.1 L,D-transpeptidase family protein [Pedobacter boryungensis]
MKKTLLFILSCLFLSSCGWFKEKPEIATLLAKHFKNKLYYKFDTAFYNPIFSKKLDELSNSLSNPKTTKTFYIAHENNPLLITRFYTNGGLDSLKNYIAKSKADGFNPEIFKIKELTSLLERLDANKFKSIDEVYPLLAELEIKTADAFLRYTSFIKYGIINPRKIYNRYYINVHRPDSLRMDSLLNTTDLVKTLKNAQPSSKSYLDLKKMLAFYRDSIGNENDPSIKTIKLNMERLRWQLPIKTDEVVAVNIPDFSLTWFNKQDTLAHMKVCVGGKREATYAEKMKLFLKSGNLDDKPKNHETPQLVSVFNSIQVNPVWNIPVSIAQSEIYWMARKDPYYLSNSNIKVYYKGKQVLDPDTIQWNKYAREKLPFTFKQGSGEGNALGKFKFIFDNSSSIYLHDTNNKYGFKLANRAISHGCVRIEDPLKFAQLMVKDKYQYDELRMEVNLPPIDTNRNKRYRKILAKKSDTANVFQLKPSWFSTRKNVAVVIGYYTAWAENGKVQFRPDVYAYDGILWDAIKKYM